MPTTSGEDAHHVESSEDLTPPPEHSSPEPSSPSAQVAHDFAAQHHHHQSNSSAPSPCLPGQSPGQPENLKPPRKKPGRKPGWAKAQKELEAAQAASGEIPLPSNPDIKKRTRRPRDPNAPPLQRRKRKTESLDGPAASAIAAQPRADLQPRPSSDFKFPVDPTPEMGRNEGIPRPIHSFFNNPTPPPPPPPQQPVRTSGQNYDPIRSNYDPVRETIVHSNPFSNQGSPIPNPLPLNRASASPSIASLVDPPNYPLASPSVATQSFFNQQQQARQREEAHSLPPSPHSIRLAAPNVIESPPIPKVVATVPNTKQPDLGPTSSAPGSISFSKKITAPGSTATSSTAASPKVKPKDKDIALFPAPPPLPGSGLGGDTSEFKAPTVILTIPMSGEVNKYVNFTKLAEEQYGWDALHPRLAAQRDRLARVAAAGAALERNGSKESGDEMSLDSEAEGEGSNVEMGGLSDGRTGTDGGNKAVPRKRRARADEYDKDDGFVDDTDLLWEEQAAVANDGFFVYSGPLVPEGEKPSTELRLDGAPKRGRGRGSRGGRMTASSRGSGAPRSNREGLPATGPGSRGGLTTRKPRITKADRARMEQEKLEREKLGAMSGAQSNGYGTGLLPPGSNLGTTPMIFN